MKKKRLKLKKGVWVVLIVIIFLSLGIYAFTKVKSEYEYRESSEYRYLELGYTKEEIKLIEEKLPEEKAKELLNLKHKEETLIKIISEKYYKEQNLERYLDYTESNRVTDYSQMIKNVNLNLDYDFYEVTYETDTNYGDAMLVNKFYLLDSTYTLKNPVVTTNKHSWGDGYTVEKHVYDAFLEMWEAAQLENYYLMIGYAYNSYEAQDKSYIAAKEFKGSKYADTNVARAGASEHQTGLALDIFAKSNSNKNTFCESETATWLKNNAYKYGFIERYTKENEYITGFSPECWHYRYVGKDVAKIIFENNITLEEYHAHYLN